MAKTKEAPETTESSKDSVPLVIPDAPEGSTLFHIGTLESCPYQNVTIGGHTFHRYTEEVSYNDKTGQTTRSRMNGQVVALLPEDLTRIKDRLGSRVIRWRNRDNWDGFIVAIDHKRYRKQAKDEALANHVYMDAVSPETMLSLQPGKPIGG